MGLSSSKQRTSSSSRAQAQVTPTAPSWLQGPTQGYFSQLGSLVNQGGSSPTIGATGNQSAAFNGAQNLSAFNQGISQAIGGTQGLMGYTPASLNAYTINAPSAYNPERVAAQNISAGQLRNTDLSAYLNPYTSAVIDAGISDLDRGRRMSIAGGQGAATRAGAYGGSRHGVMDAETNRGFIDQVGALTAGLRNSGFNTALGAAQFDINNRMGADQFNAQQGLSAALANQSANLQAGLQSNADRMAADVYNAGARTAADQFNVNSGLQGANFRLGAANQLGSLGAAQDANMRGNLSLQAELGEQERDINRENDPQEQRMRYLAQLQSLLGINPNAFIGQDTRSSGTSTSTTTSTPSAMQVLGSLMQGFGSMGGMKGLFPSDRRLKRNISPLWTDPRGNQWYEFEYIWGAEKFGGVMADEAPAHAVHVHPSGFALVDYGAL